MATTQMRGRRRARYLAIGVLAALLSIPVQALATPVDINPDTSDNSNANAASGGRVNHMASVPGDNQTFYLASEYGGLFKTSDAGVTWSRLEDHEPVVAWDVEVDPDNVNRVVASSWYDGRVVPLSGIQISTDAGATWSRPATSWLDPALEGTANDNTPAGFTCANVATEPSGYGIALSGATFAVATHCGLALSTNRGATWSFVDPTPANPAARLWDVVVQPGGLIDVCGDDGHHRSTDGGATWVAGGTLPVNRCSMSVSPDESDVLFVYAADNNVYESDDAGGTWTNLGSPQRQGRIPFVATNQRSDDGAGANLFDLWAGDVQLFRAACTTPADTSDTTTRRCPTSASWSNQQNGAHFDGGDLLFDAEAANDACPVLYSSDGGVHRNTVTGSPGCHTPTWTRSNVGYHGLWLWTMDGSHLAGATAEQLLFGLQDNGTFSTANAGAASPTWTNPRCCDTFDVLATPTFTLGTNCCFNSGRFNRLELAGANYASPTEIPNYPSSAELSTFNWGRHVNGWGTEDNNVVILTGDGVWWTDDIQVNPIVWTALAAPPGGAGSMCNVQTSMDGTTPVFFVQGGQCTGRGLDPVYRLDGTGDTTWTRIDNTDGLAGGFGVFAVAPTDADRIFASALGGIPGMVMSTDGGTTWTPDPELDTLMTGNGVFKFLNQSGPSTNNGSARALFQGYYQPMMLAVSPLDPNVVVAGGVDSGVFLSLDGGTNWGLVTDPTDPAASGSEHLPRPRFAYFDDEPAGTTTVYVGTQGRGVFRLAFQPPTADAGGPYATVEGTDVALSAAGSTDPTSQALTYRWDLDGDGDYDDATGATPTFDRVGQDGSFTVAVKATDTDGSYDTDTATVVVANVAPAISGVTEDSPVDEGTLVTVNAVVSDPGWLEGLTATIDWGDGAGPQAVSGTAENVRPDATLTIAATHTYGDDGIFQVTVCGQDDDTSTCAAAVPVVVDNVAPTTGIDGSGATTINGVETIVARRGEAVAFSSRTTDPGSDDLTISWDWGDGAPSPDVTTTYLVNPPATDPDPSPSVQPRDVTDSTSHAFTQACMYLVGLEATDDDGGEASDTIDVLITGDATAGRQSGYWSHQYRRQGARDFDDKTLQCYLAITDHVSRVFHEERDASTFSKAHSVLFEQGKSVTPRDQLDRDLLTAWLNFANGAVLYDELVDTDGDGVADTVFHVAMETAETVRLDPASSQAQIDQQRKIVNQINDSV